jgi:hypothetical protein
LAYDPLIRVLQDASIIESFELIERAWGRIEKRTYNIPHSKTAATFFFPVARDVIPNAIASAISIKMKKSLIQKLIRKILCWR